MKLTLKNKKLLRSQAYIDGNWVHASNKKTFSVVNPFDQKSIAEVPDMGKKEAIDAIEAANFAFPVWSSLTSQDRGEKLIRVAELIKEQAEDLALLLTLEQGKPLHEAREEVLDMIPMIHWLVEEGHRIHGTTQPDPDSARYVMTIRQPIGVVTVITPWNFPFSGAIQKGFGVLAAGCTVVLKPSEETPLTTLAVAYLTQLAGIPSGVYNVITCKNPETIGEILTTHPLVSKITFTGSTEVGKKILQQAASTVKKVTVELGGNCPVIVFEDADLENAVNGVFDFKFYNAGQCCNTINRIIVHRSIYEIYIQRFLEKAKSLTVGSGLEKVNMGPLINEESFEKIEALLKDAKAKGAEILILQKKLKGLLCSPILVKNCHQRMRISQEEIFGPVAAFYSFETEDEAVALANDTRYGLAAYFYTENLSRAMRVSRELEAGAIGINTMSVYSTTLPFGGWKESGIGRELGFHCLDEYTEIKAISIGK